MKALLFTTLLTLFFLFVLSPAAARNDTSSGVAPGGGDSGIDLGLCSIHEECNHGGKCDSGFCVCSSGWTGTFCNDRQAIVLPKFDVVVGFIIITIASWFIGDQLSTLRLPLITGYIFTGILAGPHILNLIPEEQIRDLDFIDHIALAFIAFAAGSKLYLRGLQGRVHSVMIVTAGLVVVDYMLGFCMCLALASQVEFTKHMSGSERAGVAMLIGTLMVARSPASAIAIVEELKASGPFTNLCLGVTVVMDMVVIFLFSINLLIAQSLFEENESGLDLFWKSIVRMLISMLGGVFLGKWLLPTLIWGWRDMAVSQLSTQVQITKKHKAYVEKTQNVLFLALCLTLFVLELYADDYLEPLLMCMIAGLIIANYTPYRQAFVHIMHAVQDYVFVAFFTLTGAALDFSSIGSTILLSFLLLIIRVLGIFIASYFGGQLSGENPKHNRVAWLAYVTQAGVALGLAKKVHLLYPDWGSDFATVIVSVVIINQLVGPPMFKWVIRHVGEANATLKVEGSAVIFTSLADDSTDADSVATVLGSHMWNVSTVHVTSLVLASEMIQEKERQRGGRDGGGTEGAMEMDVEGGEGGKNGLRLNSPSLASTPSHEGGDIQLDLHNIHNTNTNTHDNSTSTRDSLSDEKNHVSSTSSTPMPTLSHSLSSRSLSSLPADEINERISDDAILDSITGFTSCVIVLLDPNHALAARVAQLASQKCPEANLIVRASSSSASLSASSSSPTAPSHQGVSQAIKYSDAATGGEAELEAQGSDIDVDVDVDADNSGSEYPHVRHRTTNAGNDSVDHNAHSHTTNDSDAKHSGDSDSLSKSFSASLPSNAIVIYRKLSTIQMISEVAIANKNSDFATLGFDFSFLLTRSLSYNTLSQEGRRKNRGDGFFKRRGSHHDIHSHNHNHHSKYTRKNTHERYTDDDSKDDDEKERDITASGSADVNNTFNLDPDFDADFDATFHEGSTDSKVSTTDAFSSKGMFHE